MPGQPLSEIPVARLLGCRVLLDRLDQDNNKIGHIFLADAYHHGSITFKCLATGPGEWVRGRKKGSRVWIEPEHKPGDICFCHAFFRAGDHPEYHQPVWLDDAGGRGRVCLDCRFVEYVQTQQETANNK
jgi:hypothetical protein